MLTNDDNKTNESLVIARVLVYFIVCVTLGVWFRGTEGIGEFGSWLSGTLTPGLLIFAILSFRTAERARLEQARAQQEMAQISERATFISNRDFLQSHLSYLGSCALMQKRLPFDDHTKLMNFDLGNGNRGKGGYEWIWYILIRLYNRQATPTELEDYDTLQSPDSRFFLAELQRDMIELLRIGEAAGLYNLYDRRIRQLPLLFTECGLWKIDLNESLQSMRPSFRQLFENTMEGKIEI